MQAQCFPLPYQALRPDILHEGPLRGLWRALLEQPPSADLLDQARALLDARLEEADRQPCPLPEDPAQWSSWMQEQTRRTGEAFDQYRSARQAGEPRRFFGNRAHALYFLRQVAPTKLVDGAWLHGLLHRWQDPSCSGLIRIYLEELGGGRPDKNHVLLYRQLLQHHDCEDLQDLDDESYLQGALQLSLAWLADEYLPELIGFNLGYEQLPLHLPITAFELSELGIDPYYFTLHLTVDNAASGHARMAVDEALRLVPRGAAGADFLRRLRRGFQLNDVGPGSVSAIQRFDHRAVLVEMLERKAEVGRHLHNDHCRIEGRTVNQWLAAGDMDGFLGALERLGWIRRGQDVAESRFWRLIEGDRAQMFGVFNGYERQLLRDYIETPNPRASRRPTRARPAPAPAVEPGLDEPSRALRGQLLQAGSMEQRIALLLPWMTPGQHHGPTGLFATREFSRMLGIPA